MPKPFFSGRIPLDLHERVEQHVLESGQSKTDILINALAAYLNCPVTKPTSTTTSFKTEERLKSLENRVTALELSVPVDRPGDKSFVIKVDNKYTEDVTSPDEIDNKLSTRKEENLLEEKADNNFDNGFDNETENVTEPIKSIPTEETTNDNKSDNDVDNRKSELKNQEDEQQIDVLSSQELDTVKKFESLSSIEFARATGVKRDILDDQRVKVKNKYRRLGKQIPEKQLLEQPERISFKKPLSINGYPYDLFFLGQDESGNNLWTAIPYDNSRNQQLSI